MLKSMQNQKNLSTDPEGPWILKIMKVNVNNFQQILCSTNSLVLKYLRHGHEYGYISARKKYTYSF